MSRATTAQKYNLFFIALIALSLLASGNLLAQRQPASKAATPKAGPKKPEIVAMVNREPITRVQLAKECIRRFGTEVLESEVNKRLILSECRKKNIKITNADIESEIQRMAGKFGLSTEAWIETLQTQRDITAKQYRRDVVWPTLALRRLAAGATMVTDSDIKKGFEAEFGASVQVRMISARKQERAHELRQKAKANPDGFDMLAKDESEDENSAATRGLIPPIRRYVGDPKVTNTAFGLRAGEISEVIPTAGQYIILKCERHIPASNLTADEKKIAIGRIRDKLEERKLKVAAAKLFEKLQSTAKIENILNDKAKSKANPGIAATVNGQPITLKDLGDECIVRHGEMVLESEVNRTMLTQALKRRSQTVSQTDLDQEIRRAAKSFGYVKRDGTPDLNRWLKKITDEGGATVDTYVRDAVWPTVALKKLVSANVNVTREDLQKGFRANYGKRVEVLAVVLSSQRTAHEVFDLARKNKSEKFFGELAHQYSIEPVSRANFGQVPPIRQHGGQPLLEEEAFKLKPGELSGVLAVGDKFVVLRCLGFTNPVVDDMSVVQDELEKDIREKKIRIAMNRELDRLKEKAQVDNFLAGTSSTPATKVMPASHTAPQKRR